VLAENQALVEQKKQITTLKKQQEAAFVEQQRRALEVSLFLQLVFGSQNAKMLHLCSAARCSCSRRRELTQALQQLLAGQSTDLQYHDGIGHFV
jgi:hypothetical protein